MGDSTAHHASDGYSPLGLLSSSAKETVITAKVSGMRRFQSTMTPGDVTERHYIKDVPESTLQAMKLLEGLCNECANQRQVKPN
jgi:hypothetical protein